MRRSDGERHNLFLYPRQSLEVNKGELFSVCEDSGLNRMDNSSCDVND